MVQPAEGRKKRALILLNLVSGTRKASSNVMEIVTRFANNGYEPVIYPIIPGTDLISENILADYEGKVDLVLCSGGDGTLNHVIHEVLEMRDRPCLAFIPAGSTNDFAKGFGIPLEFGKALDAVFYGKKITYDVGRLNDRFFNYVAAFGAFSAVSYATDQQLKNVLGYAAYIVSAVADLYQNINYTCHMRIESEGTVFEDDFMFGAVCNSVSVGGIEVFRGFNVSLDDGKMEMLLIKAPKNPADFQGILNALLKGTLDHPFVTFRQISEATIYSDSGTAWSLDGEFGGSHEEVSIHVMNRALSIMVGAGRNT